jgi:hypothetical protein
MTSVSVVTDTMGDEQRVEARQMRTVALGLLFAAVVYVLTWARRRLGFINAGAEASWSARSPTGSR